MSENRFQHGLEKMMEYQQKDSTGPSGHVALSESLADLAPDVPRYMVEFAFGDIYGRPGLNKQEQLLVTIAALTTLGTDQQIRLNVNTGINVGLSIEKIVGAVVHLIPYIGFPKVLNALDVIKDVATRRGLLNSEEKPEAA